jgi:hypothetical protein
MKKRTPPPEYIGTAAASRMLGVTRMTIYAWLDAIPVDKVPRFKGPMLNGKQSLRIHLQGLLDWRDEQLKKQAKIQARINQRLG